MGLDIVALNALLKSVLHTKNKNHSLTLGRQGIHISRNEAEVICNKYNIYNHRYDSYCEKLLTETLGFKNVDSVDKNDYEKCSIIFDLNNNVDNLNLSHRFDYIYDGGTIEHIFNIPQVLENIIKMLNIDGVFCSVTCNNNFSGHGFYQFSPELFYRVMSPTYGMEILEMYLAQNHTTPDKWLKLNPNTKTIGRVVDKIQTNEEVYIITIARKISDTRQSLLLNHPQQFSYEEIEWKK